MRRNKIIQDHEAASQQSKPSYARPPIHHKAENKEETTDEEVEEEEEDCLKRPKRKNLYPDLKKNLYPDLKKDLKEVSSLHGPAKSSQSGKKSEIYKQQFMSRKSDSDTNSSSIFKCIIYALLFLAASILAFLGYNGSDGSVTSPYPINVPKLVAEMQNHFEGQHSHTFKILNKTLARVVTDKPEPSAPAIFTVVANKGAEQTASDFSIYLANKLAPGQFVTINESARFPNDPDDLKFRIDTEIRSKLEKDVLNAVIVDRLNDIPIGAAQIFHGFCDHESAPYKRVVYLFIVHLGKRIPEGATVGTIDAVGMESLRSIWRTSTDDYVDSLVTRLTVNVVNIK